ncbi:MAG: hypothetical protein ACOYMF_13780 [Bacteroidales bacterium]
MVTLFTFAQSYILPIYIPDNISSIKKEGEVTPHDPHYADDFGKAGYLTITL